MHVNGHAYLDAVRTVLDRVADSQRDVVLDNGAPYGDATLELESGIRVCGVSSITAALLAQMVVADVIGRMAGGAEPPPVYLSANVPSGDAHNRDLEARYAERIRRTA